MAIQQVRLTAEPGALRERFAKARAAHGVAETYPADAQAEAERTARDPLAPAQERVDRTEIELVTVDPPTSTDLDQALAIARLPGGGYRVHYAIADLSVFVPPGGALDAEVHRRGQTVYCPDLAVPLHPEVLAAGAASLLPDGARPALLWTHELDADGVLVETDLQRATVRSRAKLSYADVQHALDQGTAALGELPRLLREVGHRRLALERVRGGVSLNVPEQIVSPSDGTWRLEFRAALPVEDFNAHVSLLTGMAAAQLMLDAGIGVLRTMPPARQADGDRLRHQAKALHVQWPHGASYGEVLARLDRSEPESAAFLAQARLLFRGAAWTPFEGMPPDAREHAAVAAPYSHVTAPLRRLVDRYGLEICAAICAGTPVPDWVRAALPTVGQELADGAHRASAVARQCTDLVEAAVLAGREGDLFDAVAIERARVQLTDPAVVAPCDGGLQPGADLQVRLTKVDLDAGQVRFAEASPE